MEKKRVFSKSLILLAITSIMLFAMSITSMAATNVTNIRQTEVGQNRAKIEFNGADMAQKDITSIIHQIMVLNGQE